MTIGPEPMSRIRFRSVRLGIRASAPGGGTTTRWARGRGSRLLALDLGVVVETRARQQARQERLDLAGKAFTVPAQFGEAFGDAHLDAARLLFLVGEQPEQR